MTGESCPCDRILTAFYRDLMNPAAAVRLSRETKRESV